MVEIKLTGVDGVMDMLKKLPPEIVSKRGGPVRAALRKGAVVIHKQAKLNLQAVISRTADGEESQSTGLLLKNVVVTRGKAPTQGKGERFLVRVRRKTYPRKSKKPVSTLKTAHLLEYGSSQQPAEPWLRPAFNAKAREAINVVTGSLMTEINKAIKRYERKNANAAARR
jgi:HK97 gp10 family phage protein